MASIQRLTTVARERRTPLYRQQRQSDDEPAPSVMLNADLCIVARNEAFCHWVGLPVATISQGMNLCDLTEACPRLSQLVQLMTSTTGRQQGSPLFQIQTLLDGMYWVQIQHGDRLRTRRVLTPSHSVALAQASIGVWEYDPDNYQYSCAPSWWGWLGYPHDSTACYESLVHPDDLECVRRTRSECVSHRLQQFACELRVKAACGTWRWVLSRGRLVEQDGRHRLLGVDVDISDLKAASSQQQLLACVVNVIPLGVMVSDVAGRIQMVNAAFCKITGYHAEEVLGQSAELLNSGIHHAVFFQHMWSAVNRRGTWSGEVWNRRKNGEVYPEWMTLICLRDRNEQITHYAAVFEDITERKRQEERITHQAYHDPLTDLPNRLLFNDRLEHAIAQARRMRERVGVMFIDLDGFKPINDQNGHDAGDALLKQFSQRLQACVRAGDTIARLAGDEFTLIVPHVNCEEDLVPIAQKVLQAANLPFLVNGHRLSVGASIGISLFPDHGDNPLTLLKHADQAMYMAKHAGRRTWRIYPG
ncbi:sensor domain-containing diguanylate cyclase [Chitinivorax sp. B]|uniref:sensor domain-containing diguanylate cyclase n=1 Tax=Chitinivorax sp. B TaxID=2502235 RepID=UPI0010F671A8|nr:sensor domain-containing diguanylate cyclase [Chitinivorax sp. B]